MIKWLKEKFKIVYCNECSHYGKKGLWSGDHYCNAHPHTYTVKMNSGSFIKRPKKEEVKSHLFCKNIKKFPWCFKFKKKEK
jgi:hypothetical protein